MNKLGRFDNIYRDNYDTFYKDKDGNLCQVIRDGMLGKKMKIGNKTYSYFSADIDNDMNLHNVVCHFPKTDIGKLEHIKYSDEQKYLIENGVLSRLKEVRDLSDLYKNLESDYIDNLNILKELEKRAINSIKHKK